MFKDRILEFDKEFLEIYQQYIDEHDKLSKFRGETISDDKVAEVNAVLSNIHNHFNQIIFYIKYVQDRHEFVTNVYNQYVGFIEELKANGATLVETEQKEVIN
jgi:hypothetical protein